MMSSLPSTEKEKENRVCMRKGSEHPPCLQAIFSRDSLGSSRRWSNRQFSIPNNTSGSMVTLSEDSEKKKRKESSNNALRHTPSHPHLNSGNSSPGTSRSSTCAMPETSQPIVLAHSTQHLQLGKSPWSKAGTDLTSFGERSGTPQGLKLLNDREISQSKELWSLA